MPPARCGIYRALPTPVVVHVAVGIEELGSAGEVADADKVLMGT